MKKTIFLACLAAASYIVVSFISTQLGEMIFLFRNPLHNVEWLEGAVTVYPTNATPDGATLKMSPEYQIGLRPDGTVVWRKRP